ncbi:hypothetical protein [Henriciella litoralis]|uniref:hypothetical protein n=1 Tax=Henriciella litoralis TaxID=568102 RepID=UPI0009FF9A18|nr:hypothetical protein [Henriciella litoralis]
MTREWILHALEHLPIWCWPIFLWDVACIKAWWKANPAEFDEIIMFAVTPTGRIVITDYFQGDRPDPSDWTTHAPRAPWEKLALDMPCDAMDALDTVWLAAAFAMLAPMPTDVRLAPPILNSS